MASLSGLLQRPISAAAFVAVAAVSTTDLPDRFANSKQPDPNPKPDPLTPFQPILSRLSQNSNPFPNFSAPIASLPILQSIYHYAKLSLPNETNKPIQIPFSTSETMYIWHLPDPYLTGSEPVKKSKTVIVLLGWLGAKQKHLKKYAEWYTLQGFNVITFTFPMSDVLSYKVGGKSEEDLDLFANHLASWTEEENDKNLVFHTFSNTGWLTYGIILEKFRKKNPLIMEKIKGCIIDSAPVAQPDPQVWASGFSAAFLKKNSVATKGSLTGPNDNKRVDYLVVSDSGSDPKPNITEAALLTILEKFFQVVLNLPSINRRLSDVLELLTSKQPKCPQLYVYSSSDRVIPSKSIESFMEKQKKAGHVVRSCDFVSSPHVDHFRTHPSLYSSQLNNFLDDFVLKDSKDC